MRILFLSNYYPPFARGGYEQWCEEVAEELVLRGNEVCVLTSKPDTQTGEHNRNGITVQRVLHLEVEQGLISTTIRLLGDRKRVECDNLEHVQKLVTGFEPDVALIWGLWNIPRSVPALLENLMPGHVAYYICDYSLSLPSAYMQRWQEPAKRKWLNPAKRLVSKLFLPSLEKDEVTPLELKHPICVSHAVKSLLVDSHISIEHARVIYGGTKISQFSESRDFRSRRREQSESRDFRSRRREQNELKLLCVGRLDAEKGVHTAIRALPVVYRLLQGELLSNAITLDVIGNGNSVYLENLRCIVEQHQLRDKVNFLRSIARSEIPAFMAQYDALIFPSEWPEPFARTVLEAMAAGLLVIGTTTGGTAELLIDLKTGLTFPAGDSEALASQIIRAYQSPEMRLQLANSGQEQVRKRFTFTSMVDHIQKVLHEISYGEVL